MNEASDLLAWLEEDLRFPKFCWVSPRRTFAAVGAKGVYRTMPQTFAYGALPFEGKGVFIEPKEVRTGAIVAGGARVALEPLDSFEEWQQRFDKARAAPFEKVVISRRFRGKCSSPYDAFCSMDFEAGTGFFFMPDAAHAFFGVSPERLFELEGGVVEVDAVAGTRPRGERYARELLFSPKERYEHRLVTEHIETLLGFRPGEVFIREAGPVQHLCQEFVGATQLSAQELLTKLYPTPAIAGAPPEVIREIEGFDRGWYSGPIGFVNGSNALFVVAIRSGLWTQGELLWYAGCGITAGSDCLAEWEETARKSEVITCVKIST